MKSRTFIAILLSVLLAAVLGVYLFAVNTKTSQSVLQLGFADDTLSPMTALNAAAKTGSIQNPRSPYMYFRFTGTQISEISHEYATAGDAALALTVSLAESGTVSGEKPFTVGLLYNSDFRSHTCLKKEIEKRPLITANLADFLTGSREFTVAFSFSKIPAGFFVYGTLPLTVTSAKIVRASVGWNRNAQFFSFGPNGGSVSVSYDSADFSSAEAVFSAKNTSSVLMPQITFELAPCTEYGTYKNQTRVYLTVGGEELSIRRIKKAQTVVIPAAALGSPFAPVQITGNSGMVTSMLMTQSPSGMLPSKDGHVLVPYVCDPGLIPGWKKENWRTKDYELFEWADFPGVLFFDTLNYDIQNEFFRRLAFFVEKAGSRGTLMTDKQLGNLHGYNAHDYKADDLAAFFTAAEKQKFKLCEKEYILRDILLANKVIVKDGKSFTEGKGAVISISQESVPWLRSMFIAHEGWHGIFFCNADFRNVVGAVYYTIDSKALSFMKTFWAAQKLNYDPHNEYLMHNEFMAYLMQQPLSQTADYFIRSSQKENVAAASAVLAKYVQSTRGAAFEDAASVLSSYAFDTWGLAAGRVSLVNR